MKTTKPDINNILDGINSRLNITEENISEPKDIAREIIRNKTKRVIYKRASVIYITTSNSLI